MFAAAKIGGDLDSAFAELPAALHATVPVRVVALRRLVDARLTAR
jgi:hypothetical protein